MSNTIQKEQVEKGCNLFENPWEPKKDKNGKAPLGHDEIQKTIVEMLKGENRRNSSGGGGNLFYEGPNLFDKKIVLILLLVLLGGWLMTGFYTVQQDERGIVMRFGKYYKTTLPGLNYHFPYPIEKG